LAQDVDDLDWGRDGNAHARVEGDPGQLLRVASLDQRHLRVRDVDLGPGDRQLWLGPDLVKAARGAQVQVGALERRLVDDDEPLAEQQVEVGLLDREDDQVPLDLDVKQAYFNL